MHSKSDGKQADWSRYGHKAQKIVRKNSKSRLVRMRSPVRIWVAAPKIPENFGFWGFFVAKSYFVGWPKISDPHRDPHAEMRQRKQWTQERRTGRRASCPAYFFLPLSNLLHEAAHSGSSFVLLLASGVGVGPQSEPGVEVAQHGGYCFHIHTVLQGRGSEGVTEIC